MEIIGIVLFCAVILASAKLMLDPPERKKDPKEDEEQMEYLEAWKKKHERKKSNAGTRYKKCGRRSDRERGDSYNYGGCARKRADN